MTVDHLQLHCSHVALLVIMATCTRQQIEASFWLVLYRLGFSDKAIQAIRVQAEITQVSDLNNLEKRILMIS